MDGTFGIVPDLFCQPYIIHNNHSNRVCADLYCLLPDKRTETYTRMFTLIIQRALSYGYYFYPGTCMIDFELVRHNVIRTLFPDCIIKGCLFHFSQALWRKLQEVGFLNLIGITERLRSGLNYFGCYLLSQDHTFNLSLYITCIYCM